jgi:hypothetical protein
MPRSKPDKDMGTEVEKLGGYRPGTDRLRPGPMVCRTTEILIINVRGGRGRKHRKDSRNALYRRGLG